MKNKKILFLLHLPPPVHGSSMVGKWIKESTVLNNHFSTSYINLLASKKVSESGKVTLGKLMSMLKVCLLLIKQLLSQQPQLCYLALTATGAAFYRDVLLVAILKLFGVKSVFHMHNKGVAKAAQSKINRLCYRFVFNKAQVILLSEHLYQDIQEFVPKENISICPNGIPELEITEPQKAKDGNNIPTILFLSNLIASKGVYVLLEAFAILKKQNVKFKGLFVGGEGDINTLQFEQKVQALVLNKEVSYLGKKYDKEKELIFQRSDIFAFPTHYPNECFPLVALEAMQYSLPVISTNEGGIPDIITDNKTGFIVPKKNATALAKKLKFLIEHPDIRLELGHNGRLKFKNKFTLVAFEDNLLHILTKIIA